MENRIRKDSGKKVFARCALLVATIIWGSTFFILKDTLDYVPKCYVLAFRFSLASLVLIVVLNKKLKQLNKEYWIHGGIIGISLFIAYYLQTAGLEGTSPGKNAFLTATYCVMVPFMYWISDKIRPTIYNILGGILCITGIGAISLDGGLSLNLGELLSLSCGIFYALQILFTAKYTRKKDPILLTLVQFIWCALLFWFLAFTTEEIPSEGVDARVWLTMLYLALFGTLAGLLLQNIGQKYLSPSSASVLLSLEAVFGVLFSMLFYGERLTVKLAIGFGLILAAEIIAQKEPKEKKTEQITLQKESEEKEMEQITLQKEFKE